MFYCPYCNAAILRDSSQFCPSCGSHIPADYTQNIQVDPACSGQEDEAMLFSGSMSRAELKEAAKNRLSGNWGKAICLELLVSILLILIGSISLGFATLVLVGVLFFGRAAFFMQLFKVRKPEFATLFKGFDDFGKTCWLGILQSLLFFAWGLLLVVPGIVKAYAYSMSWYILNDHPEMTAREAIRASKEMMQGHKGELFLQDLSFIGLWLLSPLTFFIGLWLLDIFFILIAWFALLLIPSIILLSCSVIPYQSAARAAFYENLKARQNPQPLQGSEPPLWARPDAAADPSPEA